MRLCERSLPRNAHTLALLQDIMGFNRAALKYLQREIDRSQESKTFFQVSEQLAKLREAKGKKLPKKKRQKLTHTDAE